MQEHDAANIAGHAAAHADAHAHAAHHAAHELPNWISLLNDNVPNNPLVGFLHQWENIIFSLTAAGLISFAFLRAAGAKSVVPGGIQNFSRAFQIFL